eukprot:TRINITY_DN3245_c0_g2_i2.p1 TRINITY_DN3245_c0_g2~~TRINITY_DN3245_c0_g2_i2.p1  ORF type:complete len:616 (-),score=136.02 TRINITY_DN3245_c0_g2_i2:26-1873(-)
MADQVRETIENSIPELLRFVKKNIFGKEEVREILKIREKHEYNLVKRVAKLKDFLRAIEYELELEDTRQKRFKALKGKKINKRDYSIIKRIIFLFDRATHKFRYNNDIWKEYLTFCLKIRSKKLYFKTISRALAFHKRSLDLWLSAVYFEVEENRNIFKARKIFHRAMAANNTNKQFWKEYLRFELKACEILIARQRLIAPTKSGQKAVSEDFLGFDEAEEGQKIDPSIKEEDLSSIPLTVFDTFLETFPSETKYLAEMLSVFDDFDRNAAWVIEAYSSAFSKATARISEQKDWGNLLLVLLTNKSDIFELIDSYVKNADAEHKEDISNALLKAGISFANQEVQKEEKDPRLEKITNWIIENLQGRKLAKDEVIQTIELILNTGFQSNVITLQASIDEICKNSANWSKADKLDVRVALIALGIDKVALLALVSELRKEKDKALIQSSVPILSRLLSQLEKFSGFEVASDCISQLFTHICEHLNSLLFSDHTKVEELLQKIISSLKERNLLRKQEGLLWNAVSKLKHMIPASIHSIFVREVILANEEHLNNKQYLVYVKNLTNWFPKSTDIWLTRLNYHKLRGEFTECSRIFEECLRAIPSSSESLTQEYSKMMAI